MLYLNGQILTARLDKPFRIDYTTNITQRTGEQMTKPTKKNLIDVRCWKTDGMTTVKGIVGVIDYPIAIHRPFVEHESIQHGERKRYSGEWCITHIPTGKGLGVRSTDWNSIVQYAKAVKDHPVMLMITDKTMMDHPMYRDLVDLHTQAKQKWGV